MTETVNVLGDRIIVEPIENDEINPGGQVYVGAAKTTFGDRFGKSNQVCMGKVAFVGNGKRHPKTGRRIPLEVKPGHYVTFSDSCHRPVMIDGKEYRALREGDVMTVATEPPERVELLYHETTSIPALEKASNG